MNCMDPDRIYLYLEEELSAQEKHLVEAHLLICDTCRRAVEERRFFLEAANSLPEAELPADFSRQVMKALPLSETEPSAG